MTSPPPKGGRKYERIRRLGTDGPFVVEVAWPQEHRGVHQAVLLKRLRPGWPVSNPALRQFLDDARRISRLTHANIVRVLDIAKDKQGPVLVTEYTHGVSLAAVLRQMRTDNLSLSLAHVLSVMRQACSGLKAAQAAGEAGRGIIHGAVSPEHLIITFEGVVKLKDFGIFRLYPADQRDSLGGPNPVYLSIEQEQGLQPSIRSDLFALGRVFQKLLSLSVEGSTEQLPGDILRILSGLLEADPSRRPQNAGGLEPELETLVRTHGSGHENGRLQLGTFVRGLFKTETPASKAAVAEESPESQDVSLLDPAAFWEGGAGDATLDPEEEVTAEQEASGEALVISAPVGRPKELFLPESERMVVTPAPPRQPRSSPAPPIPQQDFLKAGGVKKTNFLLGGIAAGMLLLVLFVVWSLSPGEEATTTDASMAGPVLSGGDRSAPQDSKQNPAVAESDPQPPPDQQTGTLKLNSTPPGALVYINDEKKGVTPLTVRDAVVGIQVSIRIELEGHRPWTQTVTLDESNLIREFNAGLLKEEVCEFGAGWIYVTSEPEGGTVEIDGRRLSGKTPKIINEVCAGVEHELRVQAGGFRTWRKIITVRPQKVLNVNVELER